MARLPHLLPLSGKIIFPAGFFAAAVLAFLLLRHGGSGTDTVKVFRGEAMRAVYATGVVEPVLWARLGPAKTGRVMKILRDEGDSVQGGEAVAQMDINVVQARLREAGARLEFLRKDLARKQALLRDGAISQRQFDDVSREFEEVQAQAEALTREISDLTITAPISGTVLRRDVELGETVQAGEPVFWVGQFSPLRITADVDEEDIGQVKTGQEALIKADAFPGEVQKGTVGALTPKGDPVNKIFRVRLALPEDTKLKVSMTVEVNIVTDRVPDALLIPAAAERDGKVWKIVRGSAAEMPVAIGVRGEREIQVLDGLREGDEILAAAPVRNGK